MKCKNLKKAILFISFVLFVITFNSAALRTEEQDTSSVSIAELRARELFNQRLNIPDTVKSEYPIKLKEITLPVLESQFPECIFYQAKAGISLPTSYGIIGTLNQNAYALPTEFNQLLANKNIKVMSENIEELAKSFVLMANPYAPDQVIFQEVSDNEEFYNDITYQIKLKSWSKINGVVSEWRFRISDFQFSTVRLQIIDKKIGDYIEDIEGPSPAKGAVKYYFLELVKRGYKTGLVPSVTVNPATVVIDSNQTKPYTDIQRTVTVTISGFTPDKDVEINITSEHGATTKHITTNPTNPHTVHTDGSGGASQAFVISATSATGICKVQAKENGNSAETELIVEKIRSINFKPGYRAKVFYASQFFEFDETKTENFATDVTNAISSSYSTQVTDWEFQEPPDGDNVHEVAVNDGVNAFHGRDGTQAAGGSERSIGIQSDIDTYIPGINYSTLTARINAAMCHEFYHGIQWGYNQWKGYNWDWNYFLEGQARFIPSVQYEAEEFGGTSTDHLYPRDANRYLQNELNSSLSGVSYLYCIYWRFLYEEYKAGTTKQKLEIIKNAFAETDNVGNDAIVDGEEAMNTALGAGGGIFSNFDVSLDSFSVANYLRKQYYDHHDLYNKPTITYSANFNGTKITTQDQIPEPFGIDYMEFTFSYDLVKWAKLCFDGDLNKNGANPPAFNVSLLLGKNDDFDITNVELDDSARGSHTFWIEENDTAVVVVTRLDSSETLTDYNYQVTISKPIAVTEAYWDNIQSVLDGMGVFYKYDNISNADLADPNCDLCPYDIIFINCSPYAYTYAGSAANRIKNWVKKSGYLYASDYSFEYIEAAFPTYIDFPTNPYIGAGGQYVSAAVVDPGLAAYLNAAVIDLFYDLGYWVVIDGVSPQTRTYLYGTYEVYSSQGDAQTRPQQRDKMSNKLKSESNPLDTKSGPLMVGFDYEDGSVTFTTFHNEPQQTEQERKLVRYMVLKQIVGEILAEAIAIITQGFYIAQEIVDAISQGETFSYDFRNYIRNTLEIILNWGGSEMRLEIYKPDGTPFGTWQSTTPPIVVSIPDAGAGKWEYIVTALDTPFDNYPFALVTGTEEENVPVKGDVNIDGEATVADVVFLVNYLFRSGPEPYPLDVGDVDCDDKVDVVDVVYLVNYLFRSGPPPGDPNDDGIPDC